MVLDVGFIQSVIAFDETCDDTGRHGQRAFAGEEVLQRFTDQRQAMGQAV